MKRLALVAAVLGALAVAQPAWAAPCTSPQLDPKPPPKAVLATFGVLRRAATPADAYPAALLPPDISFNQGWFRFMRSFAGERFFLLPGHRPTPCGSPGQLYVGSSSTNGSGLVQGGASLGWVKRYAEWQAVPLTSGASIVAGLVPDGVAKVTVTYPAGRGHPGGVSYPRAARRTVRVRHNLALFKLARTPDDASSPARQVWFSKSGRVIRRAPGNP